MGSGRGFSGSELPQAALRTDGGLGGLSINRSCRPASSPSLPAAPLASLHFRCFPGTVNLIKGKGCPAPGSTLCLPVLAQEIAKPPPGAQAGNLEASLVSPFCSPPVQSVCQQIPSSIPSYCYRKSAGASPPLPPLSLEAVILLSGVSLCLLFISPPGSQGRAFLKRTSHVAAIPLLKSRGGFPVSPPPPLERS